jgi:hypothetical protein
MSAPEASRGQMALVKNPPPLRRKEPGSLRNHLTSTNRLVEFGHWTTGDAAALPDRKRAARMPIRTALNASVGGASAQ